MHKILSINIPNSEADEGKRYEFLEKELDKFKEEGYELIQAVWDNDNLTGGQGDKLVLILRK